MNSNEWEALAGLLYDGQPCIQQWRIAMFIVDSVPGDATATLKGLSGPANLLFS